MGLIWLLLESSGHSVLNIECLEPHLKRAWDRWVAKLLVGKEASDLLKNRFSLLFLLLKSLL
jgi:hypothetical protein